MPRTLNFNRLKHKALQIASRPYVRRGFDNRQAQQWVSEQAQDLLRPSGTNAWKKFQAHRSGFTSDVARGLPGDENSPLVTQRDYLRLAPFNDPAGWLRNRLTTRTEVPELQPLLPDYFCRLRIRGGELTLVPLLNYPREFESNVDGFIAALHSRSAVTLVPNQWDAGEPVTITADGDSFNLDGRSLSASELRDYLADAAAAHNLLAYWPAPEPAQAATYRIVLGHIAEGGTRVLEEEIQHGQEWHALTPADLLEDATEESALAENALGQNPRDAVEQLFAPVTTAFNSPTLPTALFGVVCRRSTTGEWEILDLLPVPEHPRGRALSAHTQTFLSRHGDALFTSTAEPPPLSRFGQKIRSARRVSALFRLQSRGFTRPAGLAALALPPSRMATLTARQRGYISERDYLFLEPFNESYGKWIRDRISTLMIYRPFAQYFEPLHYHVISRDNEAFLIPLSPEAKAAGGDISGVLKLAKDRGALTLASTLWSAETSFTVTIDGDRVLVDGRPYSFDDFQVFLSQLARSRFYTFYDAAPENIGADTEQPKFANARIRVAVMNPDGTTPGIANATLETTPSREDLEYFECALDPTSGSYDGARTPRDGGATVHSHHPDTGIAFAGVVPQWPQIRQLTQEMGRFTPQLEFVEFVFALTPDGPIIVSFSPTPRYADLTPFPQETVAYLHGRVKSKRQEWQPASIRIHRLRQIVKLWVRKRYARAFFPPGLVPYQSVRWLGDIRRDFFQPNGISIRRKLWAYRHGYLSYRLDQYGISKNNRLNFISDFEYRWLRHINTKYRYWLDDKVSVKYLAEEFSESLPEYYYMTSLRGDANVLLPLMDCPEGYGTDFTQILRLAEEKGVLALKPVEGSHGDGFFRLDYDSGRFLLNGEPASAERVLGLLHDPRNQYLVTEFLMMHPEISRLYPTSVNTVRIIVYKTDGVNAEVGNAYLRIGSSASGFVDNTAAGGMLAEIDIDSGKFGNAQRLHHGRIEECPRHPDTDELIDGTIPHWEKIKSTVIAIAERIPQLEYLGFDVAVTETGMKLPEINRAPDFPRIDRLTPQTIDYLLTRLDSKKTAFGYFDSPPRTLVGLPPRPKRKP